MARKRSKTTMPKDFKGKSKLVRLELDEADHKALRIAAAHHGVSMATFAREVVLEAIHAKKRMGEQN